MSRSFLGHKAFKGRGALSNPAGRFDTLTVEQADDGWYQDEVAESLQETVLPDAARGIVTSNDSPDVGFEVSINPYRGCSHACVYCFARPTHSYLGFDAGRDFEREIVVKVNAPEVLRRELA